METVELQQDMQIAGSETTDQRLLEAEETREVLRVISTLPNLQQAVLRMKHIEGFEVEEIARLTGSTPIAVRTNLSRARKKVREQFIGKEH